MTGLTERITSKQSKYHQKGKEIAFPSRIEKDTEKIIKKCTYN